MLLRSMLISDLDKVTDIEVSVADFPWSQPQFLNSLQSNDDCMVLEKNGELFGFVIFSRVLDEATLLNIAISPDQQRRGYGSYLLTQSLAQTG